MKFAEVMASGDWKGEKHVPVIEAPAQVEAGVSFSVSLAVGKEISHPNTTEHHIRWIRLYFKPENGKVFEVASCSFDVHGESTEGPNKGPAHAEPFVTVRVKLAQPGTLLAAAYCNIHGLWESSCPITIV